MKYILQKLFENAVFLNHRNILDLLEPNSEANFMDLGCDDGELTLKFGQKIGTDKIFGVDVIEEKIKISQGRGIIVKDFDLNRGFILGDSTFDVVHANQVIEHIANSDNFVAEIYRILKPGGYAVISTENASSWCNILASIMGWQIFSLTAFSSMGQGIGNPLALHRGEKSNPEPWNHVRIYNIRGLKEYFEMFGFVVERVRGAGYFPLPAVIGDIDKIHCHFMTFKIRKP